jgi:hypothetical protein
MVTTIRDKGVEASAYWLKFDTNGVDDPTFADGGPIDGEDIASGTFTYFASLGVNSNGVAAFGFLASDFRFNDVQYHDAWGIDYINTWDDTQVRPQLPQQPELVL